MKKEVFLAISIGFVLGLLITFGIWTANKNLKPVPSSLTDRISPTPLPSPVPGTPSAASVTLTITSPKQDELLTNSNQLTLSGQTQAGNTVAVLHESGQKLLTADSSGNFSLDLTLEGGYNRLNIISFDSAGNSASRELLITYSTQKI